MQSYTNTDTQALLNAVKAHSEQFLLSHLTTPQENGLGILPPDLDGAFSLYPNSNTADLYGMIDAAYILHTIGSLASKTDRDSRSRWARRILDCQDDEGWFSKRNLRGHLKEHATAYAIGALRLLEIEAGEDYLTQLKPLRFLQEIMQSQAAFRSWIERLGFTATPTGLREKRVGWHHIWRGSHIGGGIAATIEMTRELHSDWWPQETPADEWFDWYFDWLDIEASNKTGYWQRAFWNTVYKRPTLIDMGGAVHFYWIYAARNKDMMYPRRIIESTIGLQQPSGLYKAHPFCIDLDGDFCVVRPFLQLEAEEQLELDSVVLDSICRNFDAILAVLNERPFSEIYQDSHGLPGALAGIVEARKMPSFPHTSALSEWQHPLDKVCWL